MSSPQLPQMDEPGAEIQPEETVDEFGPEEPDDFVDLEEYYEPAPEPRISDATHDRVIVLIAAIFAVATLVLFFGITQLSTTGLFGADCGSMPTNRSGRCYQADYPHNVSDHYTPTSVWIQPFSTPNP
jgi:hypothetical protein